MANKSKELIKINLGSGWRKAEGFVNIDYREETNPDVCCDVTAGLPFPDNSVEIVRAHDFLEHIPIGQTIQMVEEIYRVLIPNGMFDSFTPDCETGQGAFQDPTHKSFWCENSWLYYSDAAHRALYGIKANFKITTMDRLVSDAYRRIYHLHVCANAVKE